MIQKINAPIFVSCSFDPKKKYPYPEAVIWEGRSYPITKMGLHYTNRVGRTLYHIFSVESPSLYFKLVLDTDSLRWRVEEISDGEPD